MEKDLLLHLRKGFGLAPRKVKKFDPKLLFHDLPTGWSRKEKLAYLFNDQTSLVNEGKVTLAYTLKAYYEIYGPGDSNHLGMVLFSDSHEDNAILSELPAVYERLSSLRGTHDPDWDEQERQFMAAYHDDYSPCGGLAVPRRFSPKISCYITDFYYQRGWLPVGCLRPGWLPVFITTSPSPRAQQISSAFWTDAFYDTWKAKIEQGIQAFEMTHRRLQLLGHMEFALLASPAIRPDPSVTASDIEGMWRFETEVPLQQRGITYYTSRILRRWDFSSDGRVKAEWEDHTLANGEATDWLDSQSSHYEGTFRLADGIVHIELENHPESPFRLTAVSKCELALSQTERMRGPTRFTLDLNSHIAPSSPGETPSIQETPPPPAPGHHIASDTGEDLIIIEVLFVSLEIPPGYRNFMEDELDFVLQSKNLGAVTGSGTGLGTCDLVIECPAALKQQTLDAIRRILIDNKAPESTRIFIDDQELPVSPTPPPVPAPQIKVTAKGARASLAWGLASLLSIVLPIFLVSNIFAWMSGRKALKQVRENSGRVKGRGLAWCGITLASLSLVGMLVYWTVMAISFIDWLDKNSKDLVNEPGYAAAQIAEKATSPFDKGAAGNTAEARVLAERIVIALVALQKEFLPAHRNDILADQEPAVYVFVSKEKVAVVVSFNFSFARWKAGQENAFHEATWTVVHAVATRYKIAPPESPLALGIHSGGHYSAMFFGNTAAKIIKPEDLVTPPHEREVKTGLLIQNEKRLYHYFAPDSDSKTE